MGFNSGFKGLTVVSLDDSSDCGIHIVVKQPSVKDRQMNNNPSEYFVSVDIYVGVYKKRRCLIQHVHCFVSSLHPAHKSIILKSSCKYGFYVLAMWIKNFIWKIGLYMLVQFVPHSKHSQPTLETQFNILFTEITAVCCDNHK